jgi:hypothetical protein
MISEATMPHDPDPDLAPALRDIANAPAAIGQRPRQITSEPRFMPRQWAFAVRHTPELDIGRCHVQPRKAVQTARFP